MAATAALTRSRGVIGVRTTKNLLFVCTLLCLVCLASSLIDKKQLNKLRKDFQKLQRDAEIKKAHHLESDFASKIVDDYVRLIDPLTAIVKEAMPDFKPMQEFMEGFKSIMESSKIYIHKEVEKAAAEIDDYEQKLEILEKRITNLEESQAEL